MKKTMILLLAIVLSSCGENKKKTAETTSEKENITLQNTEVEAEKSNTSAAAVVEVSLEGTDQMTFNKKEIKVQAGSTVKLTLTHTGTMPAAAMGHNFVLLKQGTDVTAFAMEAMNFPDNNYIPKDTDKVIAHTKIIGGGESVTIEFKAPAAGTYTFICSFPGHYAMMKGTFIVE